MSYFARVFRRLFAYLIGAPDPAATPLDYIVGGLLIFAALAGVALLSYLLFSHRKMPLPPEERDGRETDESDGWDTGEAPGRGADREGDERRGEESGEEGGDTPPATDEQVHPQAAQPEKADGAAPENTAPPDCK